MVAPDPAVDECPVDPVRARRNSRKHFPDLVPHAPRGEVNTQMTAGPEFASPAEAAEAACGGLGYLAAIDPGPAAGL